VTRIDWSALTAAEKYEALRTAPKVASGWTNIGTNNACRWAPDNRQVANAHAFRKAFRWSVLGDRDDSDFGEAESMDAAKAAADAALIAAGWELVPGESRSGGVCRCLNDASPIVCDDCPSARQS
jgi:hypothetical protein